MSISKLPFSLDEYHKRIEKTRILMQENGIELLIVTDPANMAWLTAYDGWSFYVHQCVILALDGEPIWYGRSMDAKGALKTVFMQPQNIEFYPEYYVQTKQYHPMDFLSNLIIEKNWHKLNIGIELDNYYFSASAYLSLIKCLPNAVIKDATSLVNWCRAIKSEQELNYMRQAGQIVEKMHKRIFEKIEPGIKKNHIVAEIYDAGIRGTDDFGGDYPSIVPLLPSGADASAAHLTWDDKPMKVGEGTFFEIAGCYRRYHAPLSRTIFLGNPPQKIIEADKAIQEGMDVGLSFATAGNRCEDIANAFFAVLKKYNIVKDSRAGYSIGMSYPPDWGEHTMSIRKGDKTLLKSGMTFHFMTGLWQDDWGIETTESIIITEKEPELLALVPRQLLVKQ